MTIKAKIALILIIISFVSALWSNGESYLISIDMAEEGNKSIVREIDPPVYLITGETIISGYSDLKHLDRLEVKYRIIDDDAWTGHYYIVTNKREKGIDVNECPGEVIFANEQLVLIKTDSELSTEQLVSSPYHFTELYRETINYHYETIIPRTKDPAFIESYRDPQIDELLSEINADSLRNFIQSLEDFGTRYCYADNRYEVASWIKGQFQRFGYEDVVYDSFNLNQTDQRNVVATLPGNANPEQVVIIGGHHDSISQTDPYNNAPGADDNASGTSAALEIARAMKAVDFKPETTIRFVTFAAEEVGLHGSRNYAQNAREQDMNIKLMINNDMIAHNLREPENWVMRIFGYTAFQDYAYFSRDIVSLYTTLTPQLSINNSSSSDSFSFFRQGYPAVFFMERDFNPYYHTTQDLLIHLDMDYATEIVRSTAAVAALINVIPDMPRNLTLQDAGNGEALIARWSSVTTPNIESYKVEIGLSSGNYFRSFTTQDTLAIIDELVSGTEYYVGVSTIGTADFDSAVIEESGTPRLIPLTPRGFAIEPQVSSLNLKWHPNREADLAGYKLYRSNEEGVLGSPVHEGLLEDTNYVDTGLNTGVWYYYSLTAVDETDNESEPTEQANSRLISLDQGLLVVADTSPGTGQFLRPALADVTSFYDEILDSYSSTVYNLWEKETLQIGDIGAYSTLIWHKNDPVVNRYDDEIIEALRYYLDLGGNLLISSFYPSRLFDGHQSYPYEPQPGSFLYDYLKIEHMDYDVRARFSGALPQNSHYPPLAVDKNKVPEVTKHHLFQIESNRASSRGTNIYTYDTKFDEEQQEAILKGLPVGVEYIGDGYSTVTLSFPLYYIRKEQAKAFIEYVVSERFGEKVSVEDEYVLLPERGSILYPNYPNPFNPETTISYYLEEASEVNLTVYDIKGRKVKSLLKDFKEPGKHRLTWQGVDENLVPVPSGIYFLRMITGYEEKHIKMLLLK